MIVRPPPSARRARSGRAGRGGPGQREGDADRGAQLARLLAVEIDRADVDQGKPATAVAPEAFGKGRHDRGA